MIKKIWLIHKLQHFQHQDNFVNLSINKILNVQTIIKLFSSGPFLNFNCLEQIILHLAWDTKLHCFEHSSNSSHKGETKWYLVLYLILILMVLYIDEQLLDGCLGEFNSTENYLVKHTKLSERMMGLILH